MTKVPAQILALVALLAWAWFPAGLQAQNTSVAVEYLATLHAPLEPPQGIDDSLIVYNLRPGSWVKGPQIRGRLKPPSADWLQVYPDGTARLDVRATIETEDGALIYLSYGGVVRHTPDSRAKLEAGEVITSEDLYFLTAPTMRTSSEEYNWLNHVQCVGKMTRMKAGDGAFVEYDLFILR